MKVITVVCFVFIFEVERIIGLFDSCIHGGTKYKEGEYFLPNDTIIKTEGPQQCVQCKCLQGLVLCEIENCPPLECETPLQNPNFCCLHCPATVLAKKKTSDFVFEKAGVDLKKNSEEDCVSNGKHFKNGSLWQPVIGPFGVMACVQCRCHEGNIICSRPECENLLCSEPRRELGRCCPICPASEAESKRKAFCLPKASELFVFKTTNVQKNSSKIEYAFLESKWKQDLVKIHTWNLRPKNVVDVFTFSVIPRKEFQERNFQILGSITKKRFKKYAKREKKLRNNCFTRCSVKIERLENSFVNYEVNSRSKCAEDEVDAADICCGDLN